MIVIGFMPIAVFCSFCSTMMNMGIAGSALICLSVLLTQIGVPAEAIGLIMGMDALIGMFRCMSNCTGDVAASVIVDRLERRKRK